jgi:flagellar hook-associated protein 1 FlgK
MGLVNSALQIGRSAITSYQSALTVIGNNIANAADPDYTRQRVVLDPVTGAALPEGIMPGGGVALTSLQRVMNESLEERLRISIGATAQHEIERQLLDQVEAVFDELGEDGLTHRMGEFFNALQDVQNLPGNTALRSVVINEMDSLTAAIRDRHETLTALVGGINVQIEGTVAEADAIASKIASLNTEIVAAETGGQTASSLRDSRDALLRQLGEIADITVRHQEEGTVTVFLGNEMLVQLGTSRGLTTAAVMRDGLSIREVHFADGSGEVLPEGGRLGGLVNARDGDVADYLARLDTFAVGFLAAMNEAHADGQGLSAFSEVTGQTTVVDASMGLDEATADLPVAVTSGSFFVNVHDAGSGRVLESVQINVTLDGGAADTSLNQLAQQITDRVDGLTATVTADNRLSMVSDSGRTFTFGHDGANGRQDTSGVLAALGINTLLTGAGAADIALSEEIRGNPEQLAVSAAFREGNTANVERLIALRDQSLSSLGDRSMTEFFDQLVIDISTAVAGAEDQALIAGDLQASLQVQRDSISGVNLDEEAVNLLKYERAFQGSARFTTVVDQLITELLSIVR